MHEKKSKNEHCRFGIVDVVRIACRVCAILLLGGMALAASAFIQWMDWKYQLLPSGMFQGNLTFSYFTRRLATECIVYVMWAFLLTWFFKDFGRAFVPKEKRASLPSIIAIHFLVAFVFTLQILLTESVSDGKSAMCWSEFLAHHISGVIYLALLWGSLVLWGCREKRATGYALSSCLVYSIAFFCVPFFSMASYTFRLLLILFMFLAFVLSVIREKRSLAKTLRHDEQIPPRRSRTKYIVAYVGICCIYAGVIFFNKWFSSDFAISLEERFFNARLPFSLTTLRTYGFTERDMMRARMNLLCKDIAKGNCSYVDAVIEIAKRPEQYGVEPNVTNVLRALGRDNSGEICRCGLDFLKTVAEPDEGNGEFAKRLNVQGRMSDISLDPTVIEGVTKSAQKRLLNADEDPLNIFLVYTRAKRPVFCRVGADTFYTIRVLGFGNFKNFDDSGTYGDADLELADILTFEPVRQSTAIINESLCSCVMAMIAQRLGLIKKYDCSQSDFLQAAFDDEKCENLVVKSSDVLLNEEEVCAIRRDFVRAVGAKQALTPSRTELMLKFYCRFYDSRYPVSSVVLGILFIVGGCWVWGCFNTLISGGAKRRKKPHAMASSILITIVVLLLVPVGIFGPERCMELFRTLFRFFKEGSKKVLHK